MSVFMQVWVWALVAFLIGALLTWVLLVRPAQQRVQQLERRLRSATAAQARDGGQGLGGGAAARAVTDTDLEGRPATRPWPEEPPASVRPQPSAGQLPLGGQAAGEQAAGEQAAGAPAAGEQAAGAPAAGEQATEQPRPAWMEFDSFSGRAPTAHPAGQTPTAGAPTGDAPTGDAPTGDAFAPLDSQARAQITDPLLHPKRTPEPGGDLHPTAAGEYAAGEYSAAKDPSSVAAAGDGEAGAGDARAGEARAGEAEAGEVGDTDRLRAPAGESLAGRDGAATAAATVPGVAPARGQGDAGPGDDGPGDDGLAGSPASSPSSAPAAGADPLPQRRRGASTAVRGGFEPPRPIQPSMRTVARRGPGPEAEHAAGGALFEPGSGAAQQPTQPATSPESRAPGAAASGGDPGTAAPGAAAPGAAAPGAAAVDAGYSAAGAPTGGEGPFGHGSAAPLPDGRSPSADYPVKASIAGKRYCTPDSPQYPRMAAEVYFASPADAERVGFRPLG